MDQELYVKGKTGAIVTDRWCLPITDWTIEGRPKEAFRNEMLGKAEAYFCSEMIKAYERWYESSGDNE